MRRAWLGTVLCPSVVACGIAAMAADWSVGGYTAAELRSFPQSPEFAEQNAATLSPSAVLQPEFGLEWSDGNDRLTVIPFLRWDADDRARTHADLREANWLHLGQDWSLLVGLGKVFWGVAESRHLVDIINQTDLVEDIDEEEKLGQPMVNFNLTRDWGAVSFFVLPGFRERTFPADDARLRGPLPIETDKATFDSDARKKHVDVAVRWKHSIGDWDIGLAHFYGTSREPSLEPVGRPDGRTVLVPRYDIIHQASLDLQLTKGAWLWKLEAIARSGHGERFGAAVGGVEYTIFGIMDTPADLGLLGEYLYDDRSANAPPAAFDDDIFAGIRYTFNDEQGTSLLAGAVVDRDTRSTLITVEAERRLSDYWKLEFEGRLFLNSAEDPVLSGVRRDSFSTLRLVRFF